MTEEIYLSDSGLVILVDANGDNKGVIPVREAREEADSLGLDLVKVSDGKNNIPVCKIMDYSKHKYMQNKRKKKNSSKKKQLKEIRLSSNIEEHDLNIKVNQAKKFLSKGHKVQFTIRFRGRQNRHKDLGEVVLTETINLLSNVSDVDSGFQNTGNKMFIILKPKG